MRPDPHDWEFVLCSRDGTVEEWKCRECGSWTRMRESGPPSLNLVFVPDISGIHTVGCREAIAMRVHGS